jgi:hypothetical protein
MAPRNRRAVEANPAQVEAKVLETKNEIAEPISFFDSIMSEESSEKTTEDIIKELLAGGNAKRVNGLTVRNVVATSYDADKQIVRNDDPLKNHTLLTFVVKEYVIGDVRTDETDVLGNAVVSLGKTHNVQTSSYAVAGTAKDNPKLAIFANNIVENPDCCTALFAGTKIDVIMHHVPANTEYVNPFSTNADATSFERDRVFHYIVKLDLGKVGEDMYKEKIRIM